METASKYRLFMFSFAAGIAALGISLDKNAGDASF
jgi:small-conductance mechanosensitive channel